MIESAGSDVPLPLPPSSPSCPLSIFLGRVFIFTGADFAVVVFLKSAYVVRGKKS
jgi:hypothetical protein